MQEADAALTQIALAQVRDTGYAQFYYDSVKDPEKSLEEGRPIFKEVPFVKIMIPGDKDNIVVRPVREKDKQRFPQQWNAFVAKQEQPVNGTVLEEWPGISRSQCEELKHFGIRTIEDLVAMPDSQANKFMGINAMRQKAKQYLEDSSKSAPMQAMREENNALKEQMRLMQEQMNDMQKLLKKKQQKNLIDEE
jgi:hypothetical protein